MVVHRKSTLTNMNNNNDINFQRTSYSPLKEEKLVLKYTPINEHSNLLTPADKNKDSNNIFAVNTTDEFNNSSEKIKTHRRDRTKACMLFQPNLGIDKESLLFDKLNRSTMCDMDLSKDLTMYHSSLNRWFVPRQKKPKEKKLSKIETNTKTLLSREQRNTNALGDVKEQEKAIENTQQL